MEDLWKCNIKLIECYRASGNKAAAEEKCSHHLEHIKNVFNSEEAELPSILKKDWANYHSKEIVNF